MAPNASENTRRENSSGRYDSTRAATASAYTSVCPAGNSPLLVSVRSVAEAIAVAPFAFEVLDFKEPDNGPLGACLPTVWHSAAEIFEPNSGGPYSGKSLSAALGEWDVALELAKHVPGSFRYAKAGLAGLPDTRSVLRVWDRLRSELPASTELVAVAYADWVQASSLAVEEIFQAAVSAGVTSLLIDTFDKFQGGTVQLLGTAKLREIVESARDAGCDTVIAGRINFADAVRALSTGARRIGVRGALCHGARNGEIDPVTVAQWTEQLSRMLLNGELR